MKEAAENLIMLAMMPADPKNRGSFFQNARVNGSEALHNPINNAFLLSRGCDVYSLEPRDIKDTLTRLVDR